MAKNGYFQLDMRPDGVFVKLFPEEEGGEPISLKELTSYLQFRRFTAFDIKELNAAITEKKGYAEVKVSSPVSFFVNESVEVDVSMDQMKAFARFYPNSEKGSLLTKESIESELRRQKIRFGIKEEEIDRFLQNREYCKTYVIAEGKPPRFGHDATIEYFFNTNISLKPKTNEDGSVDFRNLDIISSVKAGDLLARLTPLDPGDPGMDVYGGKVNPPQVKNRRLAYGRNIRISEDQTEIFTEVTGHASLTGGSVFVSDVYEVPADVDNSTGNIDYPGNVHIKGNVKSGFSVKASGDVIVDGVVEGADISAGGLIVVRLGVHGMSKAKLVAGTNVICKFIENAAVTSMGGYVAADTVIHSRVEAHEEIRVSGKKGNITGGSVHAGMLIDVNYLGTAMGAATEVEVGVSPAFLKESDELKAEADSVNRELEKIRPILLTFTQKMQSGEALDEKKQQYVQILAKQYRSLQERQAELSEKLAGQEAFFREAGQAKVIVRRTAFPGVTIKIGSASTTLRSKRDFCQYQYERGDVKATTL